jgi:adenine/guanine phosphoribosyltransferase-like PRPP-binding protein
MYLKTPVKDYTFNNYIPLLPRKLNKNIERSFKFLSKISGKFDSIAFSGMSGAIMAPILATRLEKHLILVRKEQEHTYSHSYNAIEGYRKCSKYIIVDDFICSGETVERIQKVIYTHYPAACCIGTLEYTKGMRLVKTSLLATEELFHD